MIQVTFAQDLPEKNRNTLQQFMWDFPIEWLEAEDSPGGFKGAKVTKAGVFLDAGPGRHPVPFSWDSMIRKWQGDKRGRPDLMKALKLKEVSGVIDATCGLGQDTSFFLAQRIFTRAFERHPLIYFCLKASQLLEGIDPSFLDLNFGPVFENPQNFPIYFDPMFDDGQVRKAKPKKGMDLFHSIVGGDADALEEGERLRKICQRLVIKRSPRDRPLLSGVNSSWTSKAVAFDLYL